MTRRERCERFADDLMRRDILVNKLEAFAKDIESPLTPTWTSEKPTVPGFYGYKLANVPGVIVMQLDLLNGVLRRYDAEEGRWFSLVGYHGQWSGPIRLPEEG